MADALPSADEFFGSPAASPSGGTSPLPTADQFFGPTAPPIPQSGAAHDAYWQNLNLAGSRILDAFGQGAKDGWGAEPLGASPGVENALKRLGVFNDYTSSHADFLKSVNEAWMRPVISAVSVGLRGGGAILGGIQGGAEQITKEIQGEPNAAEPSQGMGGFRGALAAPFGIAGEAAQEVAGGALGEVIGMGGRLPEASDLLRGARGAITESAEAEQAMNAAKARATGVIGEGEAGYYDATPLTPENAEARLSAAQEVGAEPVQPGPPPQDIHALARRVDPDTFGQYDDLGLERDSARDEIARLSADDREARPEVQAARAELNELIGLEPEAAARAGAFDERLRAIAASAPDDLLAKVASAYDKLDSLLIEDTPELAQARARLMQADVAMRDLAPQVSEAYRQAAEIMPDQASPADAMMQAQGEAQTAQEREGEAGARIVPAAAESASVETAPAQVPGGEALGGEGEGKQAAEQLAAESSAIKAPTARYGNLKAVEGTGETRVRGLSEGVEAKAIEDGLTQRFGDLPEYRTLNMREQAEAAADLISRDPELAKAIAMGERQPPKGLLPESVFVAVEKQALATEDVETLRQLGTRSRLTTAATTMGQRIRTLGERDQASPVGHIQEVQQAREANLAKQLGAGRDIEKAKMAEAEGIRSEVRKAATTKPDVWADFMASIRCGD